MNLHETTIDAFVARYTELGGLVAQLAEPLTDEQFWTKAFAFGEKSGNSFGHLVLHLTGNLRYYVGARILEDGYARDRDREFSEGAPPSKAETLRRFAEAIALVVRAVRAQGPEDWARPYQAEREPDCRTRFEAFLRCATHVHLHVGQMIYIEKEWRRRAAQ